LPRHPLAENTAAALPRSKLPMSSR
jgi:hypothetical protein